MMKISQIIEIQGLGTNRAFAKNKEMQCKGEKFDQVTVREIPTDKDNLQSSNDMKNDIILLKRKDEIAQMKNDNCQKPLLIFMEGIYI